MPAASAELWSIRRSGKRMVLHLRSEEYLWGITLTHSVTARLGSLLRARITRTRLEYRLLFVRIMALARPVIWLCGEGKMKASWRSACTIHAAVTRSRDEGRSATPDEPASSSPSAYLQRSLLWCSSAKSR